MDETLASEDETMLQEHYSKLENQSIFLCSLWKIGCYRKSLNPDMMSSKDLLLKILQNFPFFFRVNLTYYVLFLLALRKVLLQFPPSRMATYTTVLVDFIIEKIDNDSSGPPVEVVRKLSYYDELFLFNNLIFCSFT